MNEEIFEDVVGDRLIIKSVNNVTTIVIQMDVKAGNFPMCVFNIETAALIANKILELAHSQDKP